MKISTRKLLGGLMALAVTAGGMAGLASADTIHTSENVEKVPGATGVAAVRLVPGDSGDPVNTCNASEAHPVTVNVASNSTYVDIDAPGSVQVTGCSGATDEQTIGYTVDSDAPVGTVATITASAAAGTADAPNGETAVVTSGTGRDKTSTTVYPTYQSNSFMVTVVAAGGTSNPCDAVSAPAAPT